MTSRLASIIPVWALVVIGIALVALVSPASDWLRWLSIVFACAVLLTFVVQLGVPEKKGFLLRMSQSIGGSAVLLAVATAVMWPLSA